MSQEAIEQYNHLAIGPCSLGLHLAASTTDDVRKTLFLTMLTDDHGREQCSA